jgi:hypothetical protein
MGVVHSSPIRQENVVTRNVEDPIHPVVDSKARSGGTLKQIASDDDDVFAKMVSEDDVSNEGPPHQGEERETTDFQRDEEGASLVANSATSVSSAQGDLSVIRNLGGNVSILSMPAYRPARRPHQDKLSNSFESHHSPTSASASFTGSYHFGASVSKVPPIGAFDGKMSPLPSGAVLSRSGSPRVTSPLIVSQPDNSTGFHRQRKSGTMLGSPTSPNTNSRQTVQQLGSPMAPEEASPRDSDSTNAPQNNDEKVLPPKQDDQSVLQYFI